ncbi:MAG: hypothetical protein IE909_18220 [Campylobacterales bacterium]|nr:hypothetical protein [Campylobacterales bacterium]
MEELFNAISYSFVASTWVTLVVVFILAFQTIRSFIEAYKDNKTFEDMKKNTDKKGLANFYTALITSTLILVVFFLPYLLR